VGLVEGQVRFIPDETTNAVIVTTFPRNWPEIEATIKQLDRQPRQVLIEVLVAEVNLRDDLRLGIDWAIRAGSSRIVSAAISGVTNPTLASPTLGLPPSGVIGELPASGLTAIGVATDTFFAILNALASDSRLNVISAPHVLTSENKKAIINVSRSIPIVTSQQVPFGGTTATDSQQTAAVIGTQAVEYRDAGVVLTVTPRIGERGTVALDVKQEVNDVGVPIAPSNQPEIIKREAETSVVLVNNQTLVLGGLIQDSIETVKRGIPLLRNIPIFGFLFGARTRTIEKTELVILITPRVIGTALDAARITEEMRRATPELEQAIRRAPRQPTAVPVPPPPPPPPDPSAP
jgi:general secretion pathway protein D